MQKSLNILIIIFVLTTLAGCSLRDKSNEFANKPKQIRLDAIQENNAKIKTEELTNKLINIRITIPAQFKAVYKLTEKTYAPVDGIATEVFVEHGQIVKKGDPLVRIKSDIIGQLELQFLEEYIQVTSLINQMVAQYNLSKLTYKRELLLYNEGISSRAHYEVAQAQMLKDSANLSSLRIQRQAIVQVYTQRIVLYGGSSSTIRKVIASKQIYPYITLHTTKNGVVLERYVNPGEIIAQNKELFNVADLSTIWLVGYAFEKDAPHLKIGQNVLGIFEREHGKTVNGRLSYVGAMLDPDKKTLEVIADVPNKDFSIKPNMYAEMVVDIDQISALAIPNSAIQKYGDYDFAYVQVKPHVFEERKIVLGQHNENFTEVKSGLKVGEKVVSQGAFSLLGESIKKSEE